MLKPYQQRVVDERIDLVERLTRLTAYLKSNPTGLPAKSLELLRRQEVIMTELAVVLNARIDQFPNE
jgi:hypothetical protein